MRNLQFRTLVLYIVMGAILGSLLGEVVAWMLPAGVVKDFFLRHIVIGFDPTMLDLKAITLTFGFSITLNVAGFFGLLIAIYVLRWYKQF